MYDRGVAQAVLLATSFVSIHTLFLHDVSGRACHPVCDMSTDSARFVSPNQGGKAHVDDIYSYSATNTHYPLYSEGRNSQKTALQRLL
jgi:hypothetical protein